MFFPGLTTDCSCGVLKVNRPVLACLNWLSDEVVSTGHPVPLYNKSYISTFAGGLPLVNAYELLLSLASANGRTRRIEKLIEENFMVAVGLNRGWKMCTWRDETYVAPFCVY
jgi:hypothetical protein